MVRGNVGDGTRPKFEDHVVEAQVVIFNTTRSLCNSLTRRGVLKIIS
jgi:hypothetical protein